MSANLLGTLLFYAMIVVIICLPLRISLMAYVVICNLDVPGTGNTIKILIVPLIIILRLYYTSDRHSRHSLDKLNKRWFIHRISWLLFTFYSALSILWLKTGNTVAGLKFVVSCIGLWLCYEALKKAGERNLLDKTFLNTAVISTISLGIIQTYLVESAYGFAAKDEPWRFTAFIASQQYAAFLVALLTMVLWSRYYRSTVLKLPYVIMLLVALALNGSRTWFIGTLVVLIIKLVWQWRQPNSRQLATLCLSMVVCLSAFITFDTYASTHKEKLVTQSRLFLAYYSIMGNDEKDVGTFNFRAMMNASMLTEIKAGSTAQIILGHGTSGSEIVARKYFPWQYPENRPIDSNRVAHNEWFRELYEHGMFGLLLLIFILVNSLIYVARNKTRITPLISYSLAMLLAMSTENVIMGAGNAVLLGVIIMIVNMETKPIVHVKTSIMPVNNSSKGFEYHGVAGSRI